MTYSPDVMRARFRELGQKRSQMLAESAPLRARRDKLLNDAKAKARALDAEIAKAEAGLFDLDQERALISRALGHKTGQD